MTPAQNNMNMTSEESSCEVIDDGSESSQSDQEVEILPVSSQDLLQAAYEADQVLNLFRMQIQNQEEIKIPHPNSNPDQVSTGNPIANSEMREKSKSKSSITEDEDEDDDDDDEDFDFDLIMDIDSRVNQNEKDILKLKAKVKNLMKFKSQVEQRQSDGGDGEKTAGKNKGDKSKVITENGSSENPELSRRPSIICWLMLVGLWAIAAFLAFLVFSSDIVHVPKEGRGRAENTQNVTKENVKVNVNEKITKDILLYSQTDYEGSLYVVSARYLNENTCHNLDKTGDDFASSIDTQGECVYVFEAPNCLRKKQEFNSTTKNHHDLALWPGLYKKISSIQTCYKHKD